jgi:hypothetical protein
MRPTLKITSASTTPLTEERGAALGVVVLVVLMQARSSLLGMTCIGPERLRADKLTSAVLG